MGWKEIARQCIAKADATLTPAATIAERRKALSVVRPYEFSVASWGRKVWAKEARAYLEKHGLPPLKPKPIEQHLSPLERAKFKARSA